MATTPAVGPLRGPSGGAERRLKGLIPEKYKYFYLLAPASLGQRIGPSPLWSGDSDPCRVATGPLGPFGPLVRQSRPAMPTSATLAPEYVPLHELPVGGKFYSVGPSASYGGRGRGAGILGRAAGVVCTLVRPAAGPQRASPSVAEGSSDQVNKALRASVSGRSSAVQTRAHGCLIRLPSKKTKVVSSG